MGDMMERPLEGSLEKLATLEGDTEEAKARRRAFDCLLQIGSRMNHLALAGVHPDKIAAELAGMSAWITAFACQLVGVPLGAVGHVPTGEFVLASLEVEEHTAKMVTVIAALPTEGITAAVAQPEAASRPAALALGLVHLARVLVERTVATLPSDSEADKRHRQAEVSLGLSLGWAANAYEAELRAPAAPEISPHGSGSVD